MYQDLPLPGRPSDKAAQSNRRRIGWRGGGDCLAGRYPVKSMLGEVSRSVALDEAGVIGDRRYALIDEETGLVASAKHPRKWRTLLTMAARYEPGDGRVAITLADGSTVHDDDPSVDAVLSRATGRAVRLTRTRPDGARQERLSPFMEANAGTGDDGEPWPAAPSGTGSSTSPPCTS